MTRVDRLRKDGWTECGTCEGTGMCNNGPETSGVGRPDWFEEWLCPDCVDGRVPPDGMVEAAARWAHAEMGRRSGSNPTTSRISPCRCAGPAPAQREQVDRVADQMGGGPR